MGKGPEEMIRWTSGPQAMWLIQALAAVFLLAPLGLAQEAGSAATTLPELQAEPADSAFADSLGTDAAPADSTGTTLAPVISAPFDSAGVRYYDRRPSARLSTFSGKSVKREGEDLLSLSTATAAEAFAFEPGVDVVESGSPGQPQTLRLRAGRPRDVAYLLDGAPITDSRIETFDGNWLPLSAIEGAEITLDGQSGRYGSGAAGGVMNLTSLSAMPAVPVSEVAAWWGGFDSRAVRFRFNRRITSTFGVLLAYENLHSGGWIGSSSANSNKFFGKVTGYVGREWSYDIVGYRYDGGIELPDSCPGISDVYPAKQDDKRDFVRVSVTGGTDQSVSLGYSYLGTEQDYASQVTSASSDGSLHNIWLGSTWITPDSLVASFGGGFKRYQTKAHPGDDFAPNDVYGFAAADKRLRAWSLGGSLRLEVNSISGTEIGGDLGASLEASPWCLVFGRIERSFAYPSVEAVRPSSELAGSGSGSSGDGTEHWNGLEAGTELEARGIDLSAVAFLRKVDNSRVLAEDADCAPSPLEGGDLTYMGGEVILGCAYPSWLETSLGYSLARARDKNGNTVTHVPAGTLTWDLRLRRKFSGHISAGATFAGRWVSGVDVGNRPEPCSEAGCLMDARLDGYVSALLYGYIDLDSGRVYCRIRNLFNQTIVQAWGGPELPGRSFELGVDLTLFD